MIRAGSAMLTSLALCLCAEVVTPSPSEPQTINPSRTTMQSSRSVGTHRQSKSRRRTTLLPRRGIPTHHPSLTTLPYPSPAPSPSSLPQAWHPDKNRSPGQEARLEKAERNMRLLTRAYEVICNPRRRPSQSPSPRVDRYALPRCSLMRTCAQHMIGERTSMSLGGHVDINAHTDGCVARTLSRITQKYPRAHDCAVHV